MSARTWVVDERLPLPARRLLSLVQQMLKIGKQPAERLIRARAVRVNGLVHTRPQTVLEPGDRLDVDYQPEPPPVRAHRRGDSQSLEILFEDQYLVVVNKPPALLTVPTPYRERNTLIALLEKRLQSKQPGQRAFCIHRLDRGVSGLLVFAKQLETAEAMRDQFAARKPKRLYTAIVAGVVRHATGTFRSYLATDKSLNRYSTRDEQQGELAVTHYRIVRRLSDTTLVEVTLETGRRNQIRVHFAEQGHPVLGDPRYGSQAARHPRWHHRRLALHASELAFTHPFNGEILEFDSPLPPEMRDFLREK